MREKEEQYCIENYGTKSTFASFLPGIAGEHGIPIWCYYVNRGQGVVSFGIENKDKAIMEFYPAHQAYQNVKTTGFRTFYRKDGQYYEAFCDETQSTRMKIAMNSFDIEEKNRASQIQTKVSYFTMPGENLGALVRKVSMKNLGDETTCLEILDGMPAIIPFGVNMDNMKNMCQTAKAWMQAEPISEDVFYYRVRASIADTTSVSEIKGGNFMFCCLENGKKLPIFVDPTIIFEYDTSLQKAVGFAEEGLSGLLQKEQIMQNQLPCGFAGLEQKLAPMEEITWYEVIGQVAEQSILQQYLMNRKDADYFERKKEEANALTSQLCCRMETHTASKEFDAYCKYSYMDNLLRGGFPMKLGNNKVFYVYSRKHGDLERDYNYFSMLPEYYSQGNGNYRDVNQNRRCDVFFAPFVGRENLKTFYSLIQLDGYNPLGIEKLTYQLDRSKADALFIDLPKEQAEALKKVTQIPFTPGKLYAAMNQIFERKIDESLWTQIFDFSDSLVNGNFLEGYWCDHWTYNLDLVEEYLEIFPEQEKTLFWEEEYTWFLSQVNINRRINRYVQTDAGIRQYHALNEQSARNTEDKLVRGTFGKGEIIKGSLIERMILLCATKFAALDPYGMGIEMEGGKPGWYDALNGLPALFGSSMAETFELARMLQYVIAILQKYTCEVKVLTEIACFLDELHLICRVEKAELSKEGEVLQFWNRINDAKEVYREKVFQGIAGENTIYRSEDLITILSDFQEVVSFGIQKAIRIYQEKIPTYFTFEMTQYDSNSQGIKPKQFKVKLVPQFLEGPVRYLKLNHSKDKKLSIYKQVKNSDLYDIPLQMYKVNASLEKVSFAYGRARAFTPGWLENESIWLHMEYKYLLELLKSGLYTEFFEDFHKAAVPFLNPEVYGRSIYENSSFIASSKNPNKAIHGKGFVARLSGSTIELISMWKYMMFGAKIFSMENQMLTFSPQPVIPAYFIPENLEITTTMLGKISVKYHFTEQKNYIPGEYKILELNLLYHNKSTAEIKGATATGKVAEDIRNGKVKQIDIFIE